MSEEKQSFASRELERLLNDLTPAEKTAGDDELDRALEDILGRPVRAANVFDPVPAVNESRVQSAAAPHRELSAQPEQPAAPVRTAVPDAALTETLRRQFAAAPAPAAPLPVKVSVSALSHKNAVPVLNKPVFLHKEGMTAAQKGTALHKFLQLADLAAARCSPETELARLVNGGYIAAADAAAIDRKVLIRFLQSPLVERMLAAPTLLREHEFISRIPAGLLADTAAPTLQGTDTVFLLGIADCILVHGDTAELVDYKTDHGKTPEQFLEAYATQLALYRDAVEKRLRVRVTRSVIYSFALGLEIEVP